MNTKNTLTWIPAFEIDAPRYLVAKDEVMTYCAALPAEMSQEEAEAAFHSTYDGDSSDVEFELVETELYDAIAINTDGVIALNERIDVHGSTLETAATLRATGILLFPVVRSGGGVLTANKEKEMKMTMNNHYPTQKGIWNNTEHFAVLPKNKVELVNGFPYRDGRELSSRMIRLSVGDPLPPNTLWWSWVFAPGFGAKVIGIEALVEVEWDNLSQYERETKEEGFARGIGATSRC